MDPLDFLRSRIDQALGECTEKPAAWGNPQMMTRVLAEVRRVFDKPVDAINERSLTKTLLTYRKSGTLSSFLDLKYACFGVSQSLTDGWRLLDDKRLFPILLDQAEQERAVPRRFRKCFQGLLSGYFTYPRFAQEQTSENWLKLRDYLTERFILIQNITPLPGWVAMLDEHRNLLTPQPCERYARLMLAGQADELRTQLYTGLGIPKESWVWQDAVLSQMEAVCGFDDAHFKGELDRMLRILFANASILSGILMTRCVALVTIRYAECRERPEHAGLRDAAIERIGNPWLKKTAWDAHVRGKDGRPHETAREMVNGWIKRRLIKDFFEILSDDGTADQRRLDYWLGIEPVIEDMWFALGPHARQHREKNFKEFRKRAHGRLLILESPGKAQNNAFLMRIGGSMVVEFGATGNACFVFNMDRLPFDLTKSWVAGDGTSLKHGSCLHRLLHKDRKSGGYVVETWERQFNNCLRPLIGSRNSGPRRGAHATEVLGTGKDANMLAYLKDSLKLSLLDNRAQGGALWVLLDSSTSRHCDMLASLGFKYRPGKGWWKE